MGLLLKEVDVLVVGGGNAGFSAAISAAESGAKRVMLIDACPEHWAGGNSHFTARAFRTVYHGLKDLLPIVNNVGKAMAKRIDMKAYTTDDFTQDIHRICSGRSDPELSRILVHESNAAVKWLAKHGEIRAIAVILAAGGFEANSRMIAQYLGPNWNLAKLRGTPYNIGTCLEMAIRDASAEEAGNWSGCHSVAWDAHAPPHEGDRLISNDFTKSGYPLGLMVNTEGDRFVDKGVDLRNYTYAIFGKAILAQPGHTAFQVWDSQMTPWLRDEEYREGRVERIMASSLSELAEKCAKHELTNPGKLVETITQYNEAAIAFQRENPSKRWDQAVKDVFLPIRKLNVFPWPSLIGLSLSSKVHLWPSK
ncbi:uncharacterized protein Triagg1_10786 [Trichoderma aggressivum f. europaeum]|uniref:FAD-dependent oxidoreductase 2 FAD-binding domain-containing protein n=1 Tax=Trichoderma aggressivum f. europaeum TaxID=173218 RepID=A0AAE1LVI5_9HYPO|nr:hypothetical protein Triagg1_10786 [Trichoderma aggressivum f. europaeum]